MILYKKQPKEKTMKKQIKENKTQYILDEKELERQLHFKNSNEHKYPKS